MQNSLFTARRTFHPKNAIARPAQPTENQRVSEIAAIQAACRGAGGIFARVALRNTVKWNRIAKIRITSLVLKAVLAAYRAGSGMKTRVPVAIDSKRPPAATRQSWVETERSSSWRKPKPNSLRLKITVVPNSKVSPNRWND